MSVAQFPSYYPSLYRRAWLGILILAVLGLMRFAAVRDMAGECRTEQACLGLEKGGCLGLEGGGVLLLNEKTTRCELTAGDWLRITMSEQVANILRRLGVPVSYMGS